MKYLVMSYRRPEACAAKTVKTLLGLKISPSDIEIWLSDPSDVPAYAAALPSGLELRRGLPQLRGNRKAAMAAHAGENVIMIDDDVEAILGLDVDGKLRPMTAEQWRAESDEAFRLAFLHGVSLWGISPSANPFYMDRSIGVGLFFCLGTMYGLRLPADPSFLETECEEKEDYERTLRAVERDGAVLRMRGLAVKAPVYVNAGGMEAADRLDRQHQAVAYLEQRWPGLVHRNLRRKSGYPEILLRKPRRS